ncbi:Sir2 family NAD-dependent protein deacetylase [Lottiidibacillus patelloidae]|nr:Sir2 family NAD-dependent protein deacetylase [Lottiidibacillus patelloidae]
MGWEAIIDMHKQFNHTTLLGKQLDNNTWKFKWNFGHLNSEHTIDITLMQPINDVEFIISPYSKVVSSLEEALALNDWKLFSPSVIHSQFRESIWEIVHTANISRERKLKWFAACYPEKQKLSKVASQLLQSEYTIGIIGQTTNTLEEASEEQGIWKYVDVTNIFSNAAFEFDYDIFRKYVSYKLKILEEYNGPEYFKLISNFESNKLIQSIIFQNYSTSRMKGKFTNALDLQGPLDLICCHDCRAHSSVTDFVLRKTCSSCGGRLRPSMTLAGEKFKKKNWVNVVTEFEKAELIFCIDCDVSVPYFSKLMEKTNGNVIILSTTKQLIEIKKNTRTEHYIEIDPNKFLSEINMLLSL